MTKPRAHSGRRVYAGPLRHGSADVRLRKWQESETDPDDTTWDKSRYPTSGDREMTPILRIDSCRRDAMKMTSGPWLFDNVVSPLAIGRREALVEGRWSAHTTTACPSRRAKPSWLPTVGYLFEYRSEPTTSSIQPNTGNRSCSSWYAPQRWWHSAAATCRATAWLEAKALSERGGGQAAAPRIALGQCDSVVDVVRRRIRHDWRCAVRRPHWGRRSLGRRCKKRWLCLLRERPRVGRWRPSAPR